MTLKEKYPFRFKGPSVGDWVFGVFTNCDTGKDEIVPVRITAIEDAYNFQPEETRRANNEKQEDFCIFYWINLEIGHSLTFGDSLFLTREDCEQYIREELQ